MSKIINMTPEYIEELKREFASFITSVKAADGKVSFTRSLSSTGQKAKLRFTEKAWTKMQTLVREFDKEIAWHGVAERGENDDYIVSDILVYPQTVTGTNVEMDTEEYAKWIQEGILSGDERFDHFYFQGHSHVAMNTSPSAVDTNHQEEILNKLRPNGFYIFVIWNKRNERNIRIYDLLKNTQFETADVTVEVIEDDAIGAEKLAREAREIVKEKVYTPPANHYSSSYYDRTLSNVSGAPYNPVVGGSVTQLKAPSTPTAKLADKAAASKTQKGNKNKGRKNGKGKPTTKVVASANITPGQSGMFHEDSGDDEDDPRSPFYVRDYWRD